jgi:wyosine [tRNA(Phe)-imidazoG37] synthetase (radical SAM superfamily)
MDSREMVTFGPVPSRRLGRSLGINNVYAKTCSYSCIYCQLGPTAKTEKERRAFLKPEEILEAVKKKVQQADNRGEAIDFLTFVPDGEPALDINLGREIEILKALGIRIAVISNASLVWRADVREDLGKADWVSLKVDSTREDLWRKMNRPERNLRLSAILDGILTFSRAFGGELTTETLLVKGVNDGEEHLGEVSDFVASVKPFRAYLSIPTRPPSEKWVRPPDEKTINRAYQIFSSKIANVEYLIGYEGNAFAFTGDVEDDILSITAVHPMREDAVRVLLKKANARWSTVQKLLGEGKLVATEYDGKKFYLRSFEK